MTGGTIEFDPQAASDTASQLRRSASDISDHGVRLGTRTSGTVGRGSLGAVVGDLVKRGIDIFIHDVTGVFRKLHEDTADGIEIVRERMLKAEDASSEASKKVEASLGGAFLRGGGPLSVRVGTRGIAEPDPSKVLGTGKQRELDPKPAYSRVMDQFLKNGGSIIEHEDGSVTYVSGPGHLTNSRGNPRDVPVGTAVRYHPNGEPDFTKFLTHPSGVKFVSFDPGFEGNVTTDFANSNAKAAEQAATNGKPWTTTGQRSPDGYTWHHSMDRKTMFLVEYPIHEFFPHRGGRSIIKQFGQILGKRTRDE